LTEAVRGEHVPELWEKVEEHRAFLEQSGQLEERRGRTSRARSSRSLRAGEPPPPAGGGDDDELRRLLARCRRGARPADGGAEIMEKVFTAMATATAPTR
jgi:putative protein kinase ArgK-like GTPase of G3E family